jgi:hypothetical protein
LIVHAFDPASVHLIDFPEKIQLNTTNRFIIDPTKAGKGSLKIAIKGINDILINHIYSRFSGPTNRSLPITVLKRSNGHVAVEFEPVFSGKFINSLI